MTTAPDPPSPRNPSTPDSLNDATPDGPAAPTTLIRSGSGAESMGVDCVHWGPEIRDWVEYLKATGTPDTTATLRRLHLQHVSARIGTGPYALTFDRLVSWLASRDWAPNTRRSYRSSLRAFYSWAMATGRTSESPAHLLPPIKVPRSQPRPTPEQAYRHALDHADERTRLAIMLAGRCGLRRGEIAKVQPGDVEEDLCGYSLRVTGKGGHVRMVPMPDDLAELVRELPREWAFPSPRGGHLTPHHLGKLITRCLPDGHTTHSLRHRAATVAYAATRDLRAVQELLGHSKPETTAIYTQVPNDAVRTAMLAAAA